MRADDGAREVDPDARRWTVVPGRSPAV